MPVSPIRMLRVLSIGFVSGLVCLSASGCSRPERSFVDGYSFDTPPYVMPTSLFAVP